jgi:hypothetical protein
MDPVAYTKHWPVFLTVLSSRPAIYIKERVEEVILAVIRKK